MYVNDDVSIDISKIKNQQPVGTWTPELEF